MDDPAFAPGFRFSPLDAIVLIIGTIAAVAFGLIQIWIGIAIALVVLHFFLFCNILRMSRPLELLWAGLFVAVAALAAIDLIAWPVAFGLSLLVTIIVTAIEVRRPSYHGVAWRTLNPHLPQWWQARHGSTTTAPATDPPASR